MRHLLRSATSATYLHNSQLFTSATTGGNSIGYVANTSAQLASYGGQTFPAGDFSQIIYKFTYGGDANLDGVVNALDFNALATNFGVSNNTFWTAGDFSYDGVVNTLDFTILATNFGRGTLSPLGAPLALGTAVPEPAAVGLLMASMMLFKRRRR